MIEKRKLLDSNTFLCYACSKPFPLSLRDKHHVIPAAAGGTDEDIAWIDSGCHQQLHRLAHAMRNPKRKLDLEQMLIHYQDPSHRKKMFELAKTVVLEMQLKADGNKDVSNVNKLITVAVNQDLHKKILFASKDRKLSLANYILRCVQIQLNKDL